MKVFFVRNRISVREGRVMGKLEKLLVFCLMISLPSLAAGNPVIKYEGSSTAGLFMKDAAEVYKKSSN